MTAYDMLTSEQANCAKFISSDVCKGCREGGKKIETIQLGSGGSYHLIPLKLIGCNENK